MCMALSPDKYYDEILGPLGQVTVAMERKGVPLDIDATHELRKKAQADVDATREKLADWSGESGVDYVGPEMPPNWGSWQQLQLFLHTPLGLNLPPSPYWKKGLVRLDEGEIKTDDTALKWLSRKYPEHADGIALIQQLRWQERVVSYCDTWLSHALFHDDWWWLHPSFGLASDFDDRPGARTGRFAIKNPALQQVPVHGDEYGLRKLFAAPPGWRIIEIDYSQLEVVILAHICFRLFGATGLRDRLLPGKPDIHSTTAKYVFGEVLGHETAKLQPIETWRKNPVTEIFRDLIKAIRYGLNYGKGSYGFGNTLFDANGEPIGEVRAQELIDALLSMDPELAEYQKYIRRFIHKFESIVSLFGRVMPTPDANSRKEWMANRAYRQALNYPMQAGGQEIAARAMIACFLDSVLRSLKAFLILQIHDSLVFLVPEENAEAAKSRATDLMINTTQLDAYLTAKGGIGRSLGEAK